MKSRGLRIIDEKKALIDKLYGYYDEQEIRSLVNWILSYYTGYDNVALSVNEDKELESDIIGELEFAVNELMRYKPVQYITGEAYFLGLPLIVNSNVLIPRKETEELVNWVIQEYKHSKALKILDIGTGSGCIAVALAKFLNGSLVAGLDNDRSTLGVARENAMKNSVSLDLIQADILQPSVLSSITKYDIIISNPPYVRLSEMSQMSRNVINYEPHRALFVPDNNPLVYYSAIADFALSHLNPHGVLYLEINEAFGHQMIDLLSGKGFMEIELRKDFQGKDRMIKTAIQPYDK